MRSKHLKSNEDKTWAWWKNVNAAFILCCCKRVMVMICLNIYIFQKGACVDFSYFFIIKFNNMAFLGKISKTEGEKIVFILYFYILCAENHIMSDFRTNDFTKYIKNTSMSMKIYIKYFLLWCFVFLKQYQYAYKKIKRM